MPMPLEFYNPAEIKRHWEGTNLINNLRHRWPRLGNYSDNALMLIYEDFYFSDDCGNNDEKLPTWFEHLPAYEEIANKLWPNSGN